MARHRSWSDDDLREALEDANSMREVVARLRLSVGGASFTTVRTRMEQLGLQPPTPSRRVDRTARSSSWRRTFTDDELRVAVRESTTLAGVFDKLGLVPGGGQWVTVRRLIQERRLATDHWLRPLGTSRSDVDRPQRFRRALERADLDAVIAGAATRAQVIRALGFEPDSSTYRILRQVLRELEIDTSHLEPAHVAMQRTRPARRRRPLDELLVRGSSVSTHALKLRLIEEGILQPRCSSCGLMRWRGRPIPLHLDHIDGDRTNNLLENLRLLCPNCHAQTDTYCGRNVGRYAHLDGDEAVQDE